MENEKITVNINEHKEKVNHKTHEEFNYEWLIVFLFAVFLGALGVHRFYVGKIGTGILMLISFGGFGIWYIIDLIVIACSMFRKKDNTLIEVFN